MAKNKCKKCGRPIVDSKKYCYFCEVKNKEKRNKGIKAGAGFVLSIPIIKKAWDTRGKIKDYFKS